MSVVFVFYGPSSVITPEIPPKKFVSLELEMVFVKGGKPSHRILPVSMEQELILRIRE